MSNIAPKHWCGKSSRATQVRSATDAEINSCVAHLKELVELGEEILTLFEPAQDNERVSALREWLAEDIQSQRELLAKFRAHGYAGGPSRLS